MAVPASFMYLTESSGRAVFYLASDTIIRIGRAALSTTVRALANVNNAQLFLAIIASVVEFQKGVLDGKLARSRVLVGKSVDTIVASRTQI